VNRDEVFSEFVSARSKALLRTAYLISGSEAMAQDLVQEALAKTYVALPRLRDQGAVEGYARKAMATTAISWWRRKSSREHPQETLPEGEHPDAADAVDERQWIWEELLRLPPRQRVAIVLRFYEDLTQEQTAHVMGCSVGTVKSQVSAGLSKLRARLGSDVELVPTGGAPS
jgi:RNA polymerase sigma-70 factor (sigma-E family)